MRAKWPRRLNIRDVAARDYLPSMIAATENPRLLKIQNRGRQASRESAFAFAARHALTKLYANFALCLRKFFAQIGKEFFGVIGPFLAPQKSQKSPSRMATRCGLR
jgi:hypothetical protein